MTDELLARLLEEVSVLSSDRRRKKPLEVPRPKWLRPGASSRPMGDGTRQAPDRASYGRAMDRLMGTARSVG